MFRSRQSLALFGLAGAFMFCGSNPASAEPVPGVDRACAHANTACVNDCRNGNTLPIGSPESAIAKCDSRCLTRYDRCNSVFRPGRSDDRPHRSAPNTHVPVRTTGGGILQPPSNAHPSVDTSVGGGSTKRK